MEEKLLEEQLEREKALAEEQRAAAEAQSTQPAGVGNSDCVHNYDDFKLRSFVLKAILCIKR